MIPTELRKIIALALGVHGKEADDAGSVISQALGALSAEAETMIYALEELSITHSLTVHVLRIKALESLFDDYMVVRWQKPAAEPKAAE